MEKRYIKIDFIIIIKCITGNSFALTENGQLISWRAQKQQIAAFSLYEAEYMALYSATQEVKYLKPFLSEILNHEQTKFDLFCDYQSANDLAKNPVNHKRCNLSI